MLGRISLESLRRVTGRIHGQRHENDVIAETVAKLVLYLGKERCEHRAHGRAGRVYEIHDDNIVADDVADKCDTLTVLVEKRAVAQVDVGKLG